MRVAVVGGGVIGLCVAEALTRADAEVVLFEAQRCGEATSAGNGGWVTPGLTSPIPAPGTMRQAFKWMLRPRSPLLVRPAMRADYARWNFDFWRSTQRRRYSAGLAAMTALSVRILADYDALAEHCDFEMHDRGLLFLGRDRRALAAQARLFEECRALGYRGEVVEMSRAEVERQDPAIEGDFSGGVFARDERYVRPETVSAGLHAELSRRGVEMREHCPVLSVSPTPTGAWTLVVGGEEVEVDRVVLAAGLATKELLAPLGVRLPIEGAKGYSLTVEQSPRVVREAIYMLEDRVGVTPFISGMRLGGTLEMGAKDLSLNEGRLASLETSARRTLGEWVGDLRWQKWAGFRTLLPDGLPVLGPVPGLSGLHLATGHGMVGMTLAPTTAALLAPGILGNSPDLRLASFSIARFNNRDVPSGGAVRRKGSK